LQKALHPDDDDAKVVVCSQWVESLRFLAEHLVDLKPLLYHGGLRQEQRDRVLDGFRKDGRLLLMSTKAGSRGLNLQYANYVFHFDRCWNPVPEMQAEDRCWRMGQRKTVFVYRYIAKGTIEERIHEVLCRKRHLFSNIVESLADDTDDASSHNWSLEELVQLLKPSV
jgi:SNF2 family DNA or RNA helicase